MPARRVDLVTGRVLPVIHTGPSGPSWIHESPFLTAGWEDTSEIGAASLKHMAMRQTLSDQRNLTPELFSAIPWRIGRYLWDCLDRSRKQTCYMWKLFATAYPDEFNTLSRYRSMKIEGPRMPLRDYLGLATSDSLSWGVTLAIDTRFARTSELVDIAKVWNLLALEISISTQSVTTDDAMDTSFAKFNDRVLRTWSELAQSSGAFAHLRTLRLVNQETITAEAIRYLSSFPALQTIVWQNSSRLGFQQKAHNKIEGWYVASMPADNTRIEHRAPPCLAAGALHEVYGRHQENEDEDGPAWMRDIPVLDFHIGQVDSRTCPRYEPMILKRKPSQLPRKFVASDKRELDAISNHTECGKRARTRPPAMRSRQTKDLSQVLSEFL